MTPPVAGGEHEDGRAGVSRRALFGAAVTGAAGIAIGVGATAAVHAVDDMKADTGARTYPFTGAHQAGIATPAQDRLHFAAFDLDEGADLDDLRSLLADWTAAAAAMTQGLEIGDTGATGGSTYAPPEDTGEAIGLLASGLTITVGFGPSLFRTPVASDGSGGVDRFGIADRMPAALAQLPRFTGDSLDPARSGGDLCIQACADDPQVAVHAIRNLSRIAFGRASIRWSQIGFGRTSSTSTTQTTPRNLFGFKDGTANLKAEDTAALDEHVWVGAEGPAWLEGGSYLVVRKIRMIIEAWDRTQLGEQQRVVGRSKQEGAPLSGGAEFTEPDFAAADAGGTPYIDPASHVRLAHPSVAGASLLRRGYSYVDGDDALGRLDAGLFFMSYQRSPEQFVAVQRSLARDALAEYFTHVSSAVFAIPAGVADGASWGDALLG